MKNLNSLKPQDILVALKVLLYESRGNSFQKKELAQELGLSQAEISFSFERLSNAHLLDSQKKRVLKNSLFELIAFGVKYVYPASPGPIERGISTAHSAPLLSKKLRFAKEPHNQFVWPDPEGKIKGQAIQPLYMSVPFAAKKDPKLYELLILIDAIRLGRVREIKIAREELKKRIKS